MRVCLVLGSTRSSGPPRPAPLGARVGAFMERAVARRGCEIDVVDPVVEALPLLEKPHFAYGRAPAALDALAARLAAADAYVMVTPEYNHAPGPALLNLVDHFGSSIFSFKSSLIVSYSAGQWGGTRAAHALRPILSELGCLPVSAMVHVPRAQEQFDADGRPASEGWDAYADRGVSQLLWWAAAAKNHRGPEDPFESSPAFRAAPSQRNAPS
ncbi:hypothetical protein CTAYLR_002539 [Chrysophaeum taylorii]|uniref:NADPH-dependent FMN reductase-like domain-containing protein n=1 Tax=Chrysophaeum taylorii TaxID=2483200 RepID=A0AAD7UFQ9_9STRA|nr:hypothetical protein CTAYLR_002539 [Chrysophaeum taylorii]